MAGAITYYSYDLMTGTLLAELPLTKVKWSHRLNTPGDFAGTLDLADPRIQNLDPRDATRPSRTLLIIDCDGAIDWGGIIWTRNYDGPSKGLAVAGKEGWSYFEHRVQAQDYTNPPVAGAWWNANPADACYIAAQVVEDAIGVSGSAFSTLAINIVETQTNTNLITESYPLTQLQLVDQIVTDLSHGGWLFSFDFAMDWEWQAGQGSTPVPTLNISYPRRGRIAGTTGLVLDIADSSAYTWPEDGTQQSDSVYLNATDSSQNQIQVPAGPDPSVIAAGYPLLDSVQSALNINTLSAAQAAAQGDLAALEWPVVTPVFTVPLFGDPAIGDFIVGDDERVIIAPDERFPSGLDTYMRLVGVDVTVADEGLSTMAHTMNPPIGPWPLPQPPM